MVQKKVVPSKEELETVFASVKGSQKLAAGKFGVDPQTFSKWLKERGVQYHVRGKLPFEAELRDLHENQGLNLESMAVHYKVTVIRKQLMNPAWTFE